MFRDICLCEFKQTFDWRLKNRFFSMGCVLRGLDSSFYECAYKTFGRLRLDFWRIINNRCVLNRIRDVVSVYSCDRVSKEMLCSMRKY